MFSAPPITTATKENIVEKVEKVVEKVEKVVEKVLEKVEQKQMNLLEECSNQDSSDYDEVIWV